MAIARHVIAFINDQHLVAAFGQLAPDDRTAETGADDAISHGEQNLMEGVNPDCVRDSIVI